MIFWDSSAIVPLCVNEPASATVKTILADNPVAVVWWTTRTECISALARQMRQGGHWERGLYQETMLYLVPSQPCSDRSIVTPSGPVNFTSTLPRFATSSVPGERTVHRPRFSIRALASSMSSISIPKCAGRRTEAHLP